MARQDVADHLSLPVSSAARTDFALLREEMTVEGALAHIRETGIGEKIIYFYVADSQGRLVGVVPTRRLLSSKLDVLLRSIMSNVVIAIPQTATLLEACELFVLHKYLAFPIVDEQRRITGVIDISFFADEVFQMGEDQPLDTVFEAIGIHMEQLRHASPARAFRVRFPWLLGTIASGVLCAVIADAFHATLAQALATAFFLPLVLGLNESTAMQSMSLCLQTLGSHSKTGSLASRLRREFATAALLGAGAGAIVCALTFLWRRDLMVALVIGGTLLVSLVVSGILGYTTPLLLRLGRRDPKLAAGPVALALVDVATLALYFSAAMAILT